MFQSIIIAVTTVIAVILWAEKTRNYFIGSKRKGKYCRQDKNGHYSKTGYFCALSKCENITEETVMSCFEKPKITEEDLQELFALGIWNSDGQQFFRQNLLGKAMTFTELDNYLKQLPIEHPEYINERD